MSLIGKNPFVNEVLTSCSAEQLTSLSALINNLGSPTVIKLKELKNTDKGVKYASVFLDDFTLVHGLWIYTDTKCGLFTFQNGFDEMQSIRIDTVNKNYEYVYQHLSVTEFRSTLDESIETQGGEATPWEKELKPNLYLDSTTGKVVVKKELVDANGNAIIPDAYTKTESDAKYQKKYTNTSVAFLIPKSDTPNDFETSDMNNISKLNVGDLVMIRAAFQETGDNGTTCIGVVKSKGTVNLLITLNLYIPDFDCVVYQMNASLQQDYVRLHTSNSQTSLAEEEITFEILK